MAKEQIRKSDSLSMTASSIRKDMRDAQNKYNDKVSDLAILAKAELNSIVKEMEKGNTNEYVPKIRDTLEEIEEVIISLTSIHSEMDDLISVVGGLEFSTDSTVDKLFEILRNQDQEKNRMTIELQNLQKDIDEIDGNSKTLFLEDLTEFQMAFSRLQDFIIESVPRISNLFDELDREENIGSKYGDRF